MEQTLMASAQLSAAFLWQIGVYWQQACRMNLPPTYLYDNPLFKHQP